MTDGQQIWEWSALDQAVGIRRGEISPVDAVESVLARIEAVEPKLNAFVTVVGDRALEEARRAEQEVAEGRLRGSLHGVPVSIKDSTDTAGVRTTIGSKAYRDRVPRQSGLVHERIAAVGGILIGKTATPEMAFKGVTDSPLTGFTNNPWDPSVTAGGSSGGSAAAVAAGMGPLATGSDGGGSIRAPASCCGVVGMKPSCGRIPIVGEDSVFETTTALGPIARTVSDAALLLDVMAGPDERDPYSVGFGQPEFLSLIAEPDLGGLRIAYSENLGIGPLEPEVRSTVGMAAEVFERDLGASVERVDWKVPDPVPIMKAMWTPVAVLLRDELLEHEELADLDPSIVSMAAEGERYSGAELYAAAMGARNDLYQAVCAAFEGYDLLLTPTLPAVPFKHPPLGGQGPSQVAGVDIWPYSGWLYLTAVFNYSLHPAVTVPCGFSSAGLPIGLQVVGRLRDDATALRAAAAYEAATAWHERRPTI